MDSTDPRNPRSELLGRAWLLTVPMHQDELFSGWLVRAALVQGCDPKTLTSSLWPGWRAWSRDLDRGLSGPQLRVLSNASGVSQGALSRTSVRDIASQISTQDLRVDQTWPWILALGARGERRRGGLQCCPACFATGDQCFYRRSWRAAWHVACPLHGCLLLDRCPQCRSPLEPHRLSARDGRLDVCASCSTHLSIGVRQTFDPDALALQEAADAVLAMGGGSFGRVHLERRCWFAAVRCLTTHQFPGQERPTPSNDQMSVDQAALGFRLELSDVSTRQRMLARAWRLMPNVDAQDVMARTNLKRVARPPLASPPASSSGSGVAMRPLSKVQVARAWHRLVRRHRLES